MNGLQLHKPGLFSLLGGLALVLAIAEHALAAKAGGLLPTVIFWTGVIQGAIALAVLYSPRTGRWPVPLRQDLLALHPLLLLPALLLPLLWFQIHRYPWHSHATVWHNMPLFLTRNLALLLTAYCSARHQASPTTIRSRGSVALAVYPAAFCACQLLIVFDWILPPSASWFSLLFGVYVIVEALYGGAAGAILLLALFERPQQGEAEQAARHLRSAGRLLFKLSLLWGGLFGLQFLLATYGHPPEKLALLIASLFADPARSPARGLPILLLLAPLATALPTAFQGKRQILAGTALAVLAGLFAERLLLVLPVSAPHSGTLLLYNLLILCAALAILHCAKTTTGSKK